jgi:hypothetical protein
MTYTASVFKIYSLSDLWFELVSGILVSTMVKLTQIDGFVSLSYVSTSFFFAQYKLILSIKKNFFQLILHY